VAIVFDNLEYAGRLRRAGFTEQQAEAQVQALAAIVNDNLATKQDLLLLKQDWKQDLRDLEHRLTMRMGTMLSISVGAVAALVKLL
jgi:hypothetical protein